REQKGPEANLSSLTVYLDLGKNKRYAEAGTVNFVDVTVNTGTDAVNVRAIFPNPNGLLVDGQLVTAVVEADKAVPTIVIPVQALQLDQVDCRSPSSCFARCWKFWCMYDGPSRSRSRRQRARCD
ncbi:MAG: hypothetical protein ACKO2A_12350, partial [Acidimicrobiaceae bacterium]